MYAKMDIPRDRKSTEVESSLDEKLVTFRKYTPIANGKQLMAKKSKIRNKIAFMREHRNKKQKHKAWQNIC